LLSSLKGFSIVTTEIMILLACEEAEFERLARSFDCRSSPRTCCHSNSLRKIKVAENFSHNFTDRCKNVRHISWKFP